MLIPPKKLPAAEWEKGNIEGCRTYCHAARCDILQEEVTAVKLVLAVVEDDDAANLMDSLIDAGVQATKLASTGGFLLRGNTTLLIGVEDEQVEKVLSIIQRVCVRRRKLLPHASSDIPTSVTMPIEVDSGGATVFVLDVHEFHKY